MLVINIKTCLILCLCDKSMCAQMLASSPGPIPSFSMLHASRFSACNIEKLGIGSGDEATQMHVTTVKFICIYIM